MKTKKFANLLLFVLIVINLVITGCPQLSSQSVTQPPRMKMTTEIPEGIETPNTLETSLGTLTSFDGVPDKATTQKVYDELDLQRATQAFLAALPIASMSAMEKGVRSFGPVNTTAALFENQMDSKSLWLTPNTVSIYQVAWVELGNEPMVIETPPKVLGIIDDAWFQYVTDFGNAGPDKGKGGKFLLVPPFMYEYDPYIEKIAVVADKKWRNQIIMFIGVGRRQASVGFFFSGEEEDARDWLQSKSE